MLACCLFFLNNIDQCEKKCKAGMKNVNNLMETFLELLRKLGRVALRNNRIFVPLNTDY